ncbi:helix-turn-helix transcriptional regulator [Actinoalloteichus hymeniacidonis]|uniref:HTH luxR-type domain-containing protein n=1 Tax=Actinoalloteichus hymeniacidonis TaxID=340345 RepID=A0AAC9N0Y7_9PSEU|nr:hypothetical protein [Actinoalloteichus hymeniacidonis]AOS65865.1 hypothetical protein TL08_25445 [Actinoalloteichus hymeniacidonis]MBB5906041.1 DNA-binding NarL/FixJ family response regulator [Actinoalloteichus hymeniacidonis]
MSNKADEVVHLRGDRELADRAGHLFWNAQSDFACLAADPTGLPDPQSTASPIHGIRRWFRDDLSVRKLFAPHALADKAAERRIRTAAEEGVQVRISATTPLVETILIDRRVAVLASKPIAGQRTYTVVRSPELIEGIDSLFEASWAAGVTLAEYVVSPPPVLSEQSREILRCLRAGNKDETAARRTGLSLRTYRRRVAELMTLLGAESRFQAGSRARELGL